GWNPIHLRDEMQADTPTGITPQSFLRAATLLINDQGYKGASVEKISAQLKVTKGAFYHHNDAKDDLVARCFERSFEVIRHAQSQGQSLDAEGWTKLASVLADLVRFQMSDEGPLLRTTALSALPIELRLGILDDIRRLSDRFANFVVDGIIDGSIRPA